MKKIVPFLILGLALGFFIFSYQNKLKVKEAEEKEKQLQIEVQIQKRAEIQENKEYIIDVVKAVAQINGIRNDISAKGSEMTMKELGKVIEMYAQRGKFYLEKYSSSESQLILDLNKRTLSVFQQLEVYGASINSSPNKNIDDFGVMINDLPLDILVVGKAIQDKKIVLDDDAKTEIISEINAYFGDEMKTYEKYQITKNNSDFKNLYNEDIIIISLSDLLQYGYVRLENSN